MEVNYTRRFYVDLTTPGTMIFLWGKVFPGIILHVACACQPWQIADCLPFQHIAICFKEKR